MKAQLRLNPRGSSVVIDGHDISNTVSAVTIHADAERLPELILHMPIGSEVELENARIVIDMKTRET